MKAVLKAEKARAKKEKAKARKQDNKNRHADGGGVSKVQQQQQSNRVDTASGRKRVAFA